MYMTKQHGPNLQDCEEGVTESLLITTLANYTYD